MIRECYTAQEVRNMIEARVNKAGSYIAFALECGTGSGGHVHDMMTGRRPPAKKILAALGLEAETVYVKVRE